jgi:hypothetical protein
LKSRLARGADDSQIERIAAAIDAAASAVDKS